MRAIPHIEECETLRATKPDIQMSANLTENLIQKFRNKRYRDGVVASRVRNWIAFQIRTLRKQRGWSQIDFAEKTNKPQSVISRLEDPGYGKLTVQTLLDLAATFNVALLIKFVDFPTFIRQTSDVSSSAMTVEEYAENLQSLTTSAKTDDFLRFVERSHVNKEIYFGNFSTDEDFEKIGAHAMTDNRTAREGAVVYG